MKHAYHQCRPKILLVLPPSHPSRLVTACHGWVTIKRDDISQVMPPAWNDVDPEVDWHWAIVYEFVPSEEQDIEIGQAHLVFSIPRAFLWNRLDLTIGEAAD